MPQIIFRSGPDQAETCVQAASGISLMAVAVRNDLGLAAECGGACSCATCHVVVDVDWFDRLPPMGGQEEGMLDFVEGLEATSRLSCQIMLDESMDGLRVSIPQAD
jgi:2Fe-2S ferredoxin